MRQIYFSIFFFFLTFSSFASETLYKIVSKPDWVQEEAQNATTNLHNGGKPISLISLEQIESTANALYHGDNDLLLLELKIANTDTLLKWEAADNCPFYQPYYHGNIPKKYVVKIYPLLPDISGNFALPKDLAKQKKKSFFMPGILVSKVLHYQNWQNKKRLYKLQNENFIQPKVRLQWWYFDFFLNDSSTVVLAFIPQKWWDKKEGGADKDGLFMISHRKKDGEVRSFSASILPSDIKGFADKLEVDTRLLIQSSGTQNDRTYSIRLNFPEITGVFNIVPTQAPFAPFPTGVMPGYLQTLISGAPRGVPSFSYVSQVPQGNLSGSMQWGSDYSEIAGHAYHEQGRLDDTPEKQSSCWSWYHFTADGWNIFGSPGTLIFVQKGNEVSRSGFHLVSGDYGIRNRAFSSPEHKKIITGGEIYFHHKDLTFSLNMQPATSKALIAYLSPDPNQVWATVEGPAKLSVQEGKTEKVIEGRMLLETCSWAQAKMP